jgi:hypothetical protein
MEVFNANLASNELQTYDHSYPAVQVTPSKTVALAFPPGSGAVVILSFAVTGN